MMTAPLQDAQKFATRGLGAPHVQMLEREVRALHIVEPNPPLRVKP